MKVLCRAEGSGCSMALENFNHDNSLIRVKNIEAGNSYKGRIGISKIAFITSGSGSLNTHKITNCTLTEKTAILLPIGSDFSINAHEDMKVITCKIIGNIRICDIHSFESLLDDIPEPENRFTTLELNDKLWEFINDTVSYINDGLCCESFLKMKISEMFYILRAYYPKQLIAEFFLPLITKDVKFANFIYDNWDKVKTLDELASMYNLSLSGFTKKFKKVFGVAPYKWIMNKKGELIYNELRSSDKSIKQIGIDYNFCSVQHFCDYCKKKFGMPPGRIRQGVRKPLNS